MVVNVLKVVRRKVEREENKLKCIPLAPNSQRKAKREVIVSTAFIVLALVSRLIDIGMVLLTQRSTAKTAVVIWVVFASLFAVKHHVNNINSAIFDLTEGAKVNSVRYRRLKSRRTSKERDKPKEMKNTKLNKAWTMRMSGKAHHVLEEEERDVGRVIEYDIELVQRRKKMALFLFFNGLFEDLVAFGLAVFTLWFSREFFGQDLIHCLQCYFGESTAMSFTTPCTERPLVPTYCLDRGVLLIVTETVLFLLSCITKVTFLRDYFWLQLLEKEFRQELERELRMENSALDSFQEGELTTQELVAVVEFRQQYGHLLKFEDHLQVNDIRLLAFHRSTMGVRVRLLETLHAFKEWREEMYPVRKAIVAGNMALSDFPHWDVFVKSIPYVDLCRYDAENGCLVHYCHIGREANTSQLFESLSETQLEETVKYILERNLLLVETYSVKYKRLVSVRVICEANSSPECKDLKAVARFLSKVQKLAAKYPFQVELLLWRPNLFFNRTLLSQLAMSSKSNVTGYYTVQGLAQKVSMDFIPQEIGGRLDVNLQKDADQPSEQTQIEADVNTNTDADVNTNTDADAIIGPDPHADANADPDPHVDSDVHVAECTAEKHNWWGVFSEATRRKKETRITFQEQLECSWLNELIYFEGVTLDEVRKVGQIIAYLKATEVKIRALRDSNQGLFEKKQLETRELLEQNMAQYHLASSQNDRDLDMTKLENLSHLECKSQMFTFVKASNQTLEELGSLCLGPVVVLRWLRKSGHLRHLAASHLLRMIQFRQKLELDRFDAKLLEHNWTCDDIASRVLKIWPCCPVLDIDTKNKTVIAFGGLVDFMDSRAAKSAKGNDLQESTIKVFEFWMLLLDILSYKWKRIARITTIIRMDGFHKPKSYTTMARLASICKRNHMYYAHMFRRPDIVIAPFSQRTLDLIVSVLRLTGLPISIAMTEKVRFVSSQDGLETLDTYIESSLIDFNAMGKKQYTSQSEFFALFPHRGFNDLCNRGDRESPETDLVQQEKKTKAKKAPRLSNSAQQMARKLSLFSSRHTKVQPEID